MSCLLSFFLALFGGFLWSFGVRPRFLPCGGVHLGTALPFLVSANCFLYVGGAVFFSLSSSRTGKKNRWGKSWGNILGCADCWIRPARLFPKNFFCTCGPIFSPLFHFIPPSELWARPCTIVRTGRSYKKQTVKQKNGCGYPQASAKPVRLLSRTPVRKSCYFLCLFSISLYPWTLFFSSACVCGCFCPLLFSPFLSKAQTNATFTICVRLIVLGYLKNIFFLEREVLARFCLMFKVWLLLCPVVVVFLSV